MDQKLKAAVIGAGAAGLVCARELVRQGIDVTVYEQSNQVGGVWVYDAGSDDDITGVDPRHRVHSSLYDSLRTNLPRDLMAFSDYTFDSRGGGDDAWPRYPDHIRVLEYLTRFAVDFDLLKLIRFKSTVTSIELIDRNLDADATKSSSQDRWVVECIANGEGDAVEKLQTTYDAVAVCNGHYSRPRVPQLDGIETFPGYLIHSHNYRRPDQFKDMRVAVWGTAASGADIAREIAPIAREVFWCGNAFELPAERTAQGMHLYPSPTGFAGDELIFNQQTSVKKVDAFVYCTGYEYEFPFLNNGIISVKDNWVHPLYLDLISARHHRLAFIGLPFLVIPFPLFEMQSRWFARALSGEMELPDQEKIDQEIKKSHRNFARDGVPQHHYHRLGDAQTDYINLLAAQCGAEPVQDWYIGLALEAQKVRMSDPEGFRSRPLKYHGPTVVSDQSKVDSG